jgi:hypothetical protein
MHVQLVLVLWLADGTVTAAVMDECAAFPACDIGNGRCSSQQLLIMDGEPTASAEHSSVLAVSRVLAVSQVLAVSAH